MANGRIENSDLFAPNLGKETVETFKQLNIVLNKTEKNLKDIVKTTVDATKVLPKTQKEINNFNNATNKQKQTVVLLDKVQKQRQQTLQKITVLESKRGKQLEKTKLQLQKVRQETKQHIKENNKLNSSYDRAAAKLNRLGKELKNVAFKEGVNSKATRKLAKEYDLLRNKVFKAEKVAGQFQRNVGNYPKVIGGATNALRSMGLAVGGLAIIKNIVGIFSEFEQESANLASVLGKTSSQITRLTEDAKRLGAITSFTAKEVIQLQTEFAKLGFNETEILNATEATLQLAAATGTELSESAAVAGATLGGFGLSAKSTQRVVDVMAKSFSSSALDMEKFKESMKNAAPAAKAVGLSVEKTTALLGTLASAGITGSKAGNNLKTGFIKLNEKGLELDEALEKIANSSDKLGTAVELVGINSANAFTVLAAGRKSTDELTTGLENAGGAAKRMADTQLNTLSGKMKLLTSAWEGFILSLESGDGILAQVIGTAIELFTELFTLLSGGEKTVADLEFEQAKSNKTFNRSIDILKDANQPLEVRQRIIEDLNATYGDYLPNLVTEQTSLEELEKIQKQFNEAAERRLLIAKAQLVQDAAKEQQAERLKLIVAAEMNDISQLSFIDQQRYKIIFGNELLRQQLIKETTEEYNAQEAMLDRILNATQAISGAERAKANGSRAKKGSIVDSVTSSNKTKRKEQLDEGIGDYEQFLKDSKDAAREHNEFLRAQDDIALDEYDAFIQEDKDLKEKRFKSDERWYKINQEQRDKELEELIKEEEELLQKRTQFIIEGADVVNDLLQKKADERIALLDKELAANKKFQDEIIALNQKGIVSTEENIAFEKKKAAELELLKQQELELQAKRELVVTAVQTYAGYVQNGESGASALASTVTDIGVLKAFINTLDFFLDGTDDTGTVANPLDPNGGRLAMLHDNEQVWSQKNVKAGGNRTRDEAISALNEYDSLGLGSKYSGGNNAINKAMQMHRFQSNGDVLAMGDKIEAAIKENASTTHFDYDNMKDSFIRSVRTQNKIENFIYKKSKLF